MGSPARIKGKVSEGKRVVSLRMKGQLLAGSPIREVYEEGLRRGKIYGTEAVFDFSIGNPNLPPPATVKEALLEYLDDETIHGYTVSAGYPEVRQKIAESLNRRFCTSFDSLSIIMTVGAAGGINVLLRALIDPQDEIVVFAPFFSAYRGYTSNVFAKLVTVSPQEDCFQPDFNDFERKITSKTKVVIINSPNNPTGVIYTEKTIKSIARILNAKQKEYGHDIYLISDEPYRELVYENITVPYVTKYYANTLVVYSFSKSLSLPGERIGYIVIPDEVSEVQELRKAVCVAINMLGFVNAPSLFQKVVSHCLEDKIEIGYYERNRNTLYENLKKMGFDMLKPQGAFYLFLKTPCEEKEFLSLAREYNLLFVGGSVFGYPGYVRISFCVTYDKIVNSLSSFKMLAQKCNLEERRYR